MNLKVFLRTEEHLFLYNDLVVLLQVLRVIKLETYLKSRQDFILNVHTIPDVLNKQIDEHLEDHLLFGQHELPLSFDLLFEKLVADPSLEKEL